MKLVTKKQQAEIDAMMIKKLRFVARETLRSNVFFKSLEEFDKHAQLEMRRAEQVYYADDVM